MHVAIVSPYDLGKPGGVQDQVIRLAGWLEHAGHSATVIGPGTKGPPGAVLVAGTSVVKANAAATPIALDPRVRSKIRDATAGADVVHIHEPLMPMVSLTASRIGDLPTVGTFHADAPPWARKGYAALSPLVGKILGKLDVITTVSPVAQSAIDRVVDARIIPNGIEVDAYGHGESVVGRVAFLGRDDPRKGLDVLLDAWPAIHAAHGDATLQVMGARRDQPLDGVEFVGPVGNAEKYARLAEAEIFVAPNLRGESFGITVAEGMASRCAVVASGIPAFLHVLGDTGEIVAPGDAGDLQSSISGLLSDRTRRTRLARAARERVTMFDGVHVAHEYLSAYEDAVAAHRS